MPTKKLPVPDPRTDAPAYVRAVMARHNGKVPASLCVDMSDAWTAYNILHAVETEGRGATFTEASATMKAKYPDLVKRLGLGQETQ